MFYFLRRYIWGMKMKTFVFNLQWDISVRPIYLGVPVSTFCDVFL